MFTLSSKECSAHCSALLAERRTKLCYRPQTQAQSRLWFAPDFHDRFPDANFHLLVALTHEYRSRLFAPSAGDALGQEASGYSVFGGQLEMGIGTGVVSLSYRNMMGLNYETFPGYLMPRITSVYGLRWQFWN